MNFLEEAKKEEATLIEKLQIVRNVIRYWGGEENQSMELTSSSVFPTKATKEKQILWLFENKITKALKLKSVQDLYNAQIGNDSTKIDNTVRRLRTESKLLFVKYNDKNILSYWGLPNWVDGNDFKDEYRPDAESLPEITSSEVNIGEKESLL